MVDLRYRNMKDYSYTISCLFAGIYIADDPSDSKFVEDHIINDAGQADGDLVLEDFIKWGEASIRHFNYDQATLLTGRDIGYYQEDGIFNKGLRGYAYLYHICDPYGYSINEMTEFRPSMGMVVAHELGHNLGSQHDGYTNSCPDGYVMSTYFYVSKDSSRNKKLWQFSSCSQTYIDSFITSLNHANCLTARTATGNDDIDPYANDLAGQVYNPDTQCEMMQGKGSFLYRTSYNSDYSTICSKLLCSIPDRTDYTTGHLPWYGTTCGHGKMCQSGHCVESPLAPPVDDEACPFGDTPYIVPNKKLSCSDLLGSPATTYNCYHQSTRQHCCDTCEAIKKTYRAYVDCDYGDMKSYCVGMSLQLCRNSFKVCCKTCQDIRLDIPGCPWGDEYTDCTQSHCTNDFSKCCQTCAATNTALTTAATSTTSTSKPLPTAATSTTTTSKPLSTAATSTKATDPPSATGTIKTTAKTADTTTTTSEPVARISTTNTLIILNFIIHHVIIGLFIGI